MKRFIGILLAVCMVMTMLPTAFAEGTEILEINNLNDLKAFRDSVNAGNKYSNKTVNLNADIDLNGETWTPIASFAGTFDGNNYTISNFKLDSTNADAGFFNRNIQ